MNSLVSPPPNKSGQKDMVIILGLLLAFTLTRAIVFPYAENLYGDSVVRAEIAERWAKDPKIYRGFGDGVYQFGPLHFYYMGSILKIWPSREHATRFASLIMGILVVIPVFRLGRRLFSRPAAIVTGLAMSAWALHIQTSTTAASEAIFLTLLFFGLDYLFQGIEEERFAPLAWAALFSNLFCALRYDGWMYFPLFGVLIALSGKDRIASITRAVLFLGLCILFPLWWMQQNETSMGNALYPFNYINQYHLNWIQDSISRNGPLGQRLLALFFWPGTILVTCSFLVGLLALAGLIRAFVHKKQRALALIALIPAAYYTFRGAVLLDFSPLARFYVVPVAIALFFVKDGFDWIAGRLSLWARRSVAVATASLCIATPLWLGFTTAWKSGQSADHLRPISPLSTVPVDQMSAARFLQKNVTPHQTVVLDESPGYIDINIAFFTGLPEEQLIRRRWENFEQHLAKKPHPQWLFASIDGKLASEGIHPGDETITWRTHTFRKVLVASDKIFVYHQE